MVMITTSGGETSSSGSATSTEETGKEIFQISTNLMGNLDSPLYHSKEDQDVKTGYPPTNDALVSHILPLYHMYTSTLSKSINATDEPRGFEPPTYDDVSTVSSDVASMGDIISSGTSTVSSSLTNGALLQNPNLILADENTCDWQNTILDNLHKLKNLNSRDIQIDVKFTRNVGQIGEDPEFIDILNYEYKQGDLINGYFLIKNLGTKPIPFDMFYVVFEGYYRVRSAIRGDTHDVFAKKFLEMFDFSASWHSGYISRLVTEYYNNYQCPNLKDTKDNTSLSFGEERIIHPNITYKRFFTFKIPEKLLDSSCEHNLLRHTEIPPSVGFSCAPNTYDGNKVTPAISEERKLKDFLFMDTSISYNICARFIGKSNSRDSDNLKSKLASQRTLVANAEGNEFTILKDTATCIRILEESKKYTPSERKYLDRISKSQAKDFFERVDAYIERGNQLLKPNKNGLTSMSLNSSTSLNLTPSPTLSSSSSISGHSSLKTSVCLELAKVKQMYKPSSGCKKYGIYGQEDFYKVFHPMQKKNFSSSKYLGTLLMASPKIIPTIKYVPPKFYCHTIEGSFDDSNWTVEVPLDFEFTCLLDFKNGTDFKLPEIKSISAELVVFTIKTDNSSFPFDISYDMIFDDNKSITKAAKLVYEYNSAIFELKVLKPARQRAEKLQEISKKLGPSQFRIDADLARDLKCLCKISTKRIGLPIDDVAVLPIDGRVDQPLALVEEIPWRHQNVGGGQSPVFKKSLKLSIDLTTAHLKGFSSEGKKAYDEFCLIPTFQLCHMARFYYITTAITLQKGNVICIQTPLEVEK